MKRTTKILFYIIFVIILVKTILVLFISTPTIYTDEFIYLKMAQGFFQNFNFNIHNIPTSNYHPLYPILLSISFLVNNAYYSYIIMKILNSILTSLIIIPAYLFAKEFLNEKKALLTATLIAIMPMNLVFPAFIMAENIFYPLFLTSLYLIYKSFIEKNYKFDILAGIFIGLAFLTRFAGLALVLIVMAMLFYKIIKKEFREIPKKTIMGAIALFTVSPWLIRNVLLAGFSLNGIIGQYSNEIAEQTNNYYLNLIYWIFLYGSYFMLASLIIIMLFAFTNLKEKFKDKKMKIFTLLAIFTLIVIIIGGAQHATASWPKETTNLQGLTGRPIGRYIDTALPILFLLGIISYYKYNKKDKKSERNILLVSVPLILLSSQLLYFKLLPANNITLTALGAANEFLRKFLDVKITIILLTTILLVILFTIYMTIKKSRINAIKPITLLSIFLLLTSAIAYGGTIHNSKINWENNPQIKLSKWIGYNINKNAKIVIDEDYCGVLTKTAHDILCTNGKSTALTSLWTLNPIDIKSIENTDAEYIITKKELNLKIVKKTENNIYLYKNENSD